MRQEQKLVDKDASGTHFKFTTLTMSTTHNCEQALSEAGKETNETHSQRPRVSRSCQHLRVHLSHLESSLQTAADAVSLG